MSYFIPVDELVGGSILSSASVVLPGYGTPQTVLIPAVGATIYVYQRGTTVQVNLYEDQHGAGSPVTQPLTTDASGHVVDGSANRVYVLMPQEIDINVSGAGLTPRTIPAGQAVDTSLAPLVLPSFVGPVQITGAAPRVTAGPAGGTSPPISLTSGSDDTSGTIIFTPGAGADNSDDLVTVTFSAPLGAGVLPQVLVRGADIRTAMLDFGTQHETQFGFGIAVAGMPAVGLVGLTLSIKYLMIASS